MTIGQAHAQKLTTAKDSRRVDLDLCQKNHSLILKTMSRNIDGQISRLLNGIDLELMNRADEATMNSYFFMLDELIAGRILFRELHKQLQDPGLKKFIEEHKNFNTPYLRPDGIALDLNNRIKQDLDKLVTTLDMGQETREIIKREILDINTRYFIGSRTLQLGITFAEHMGIQLAKKGISRLSFILSAKSFLLTPNYTILSVLTIPLHGHKTTAEESWVNLLENYPEFIFVPEWMSYGGVKDHPWMAHCSALQRRTKVMEFALERVIRNEENTFIQLIQKIQKNKKTAQNGGLDRLESIHPPRDNMRLVNKTIPGENLIPSWARLYPK
jgi:hypothetical protein